MTSKERIQTLQKYIGANADGVIGSETLNKFAAKFNKTRSEVIHFFANIHHESGGFTIVRENMNYTSGRIMEIFGVGKHSAKITLQEANYLSGKPYELAERVYGLGNPKKAKELGNTSPGDGWLFRGGGALQITGGWAYKEYGGLELYNNPDLVGESAYYFTTAIKEFDKKNIWKYAKDLSYQSVLNTARVINIGTANTKTMPNGLKDRQDKIEYYNRIWKTKTT